jgi:simple sugar transport system permease protein/D-ribose pyranase
VEGPPVNRNRLLNAQLSHAIASMGHGELMIVLEPLAQNFIAEKVSYAEEIKAHNKPLLAKVEKLFAGADFAPIPHATILGEMAAKAKVIVRTGAFDPWGNILLYSGVDVPKWFSKEGVVAPDYYAKKL